MEKPLQVITAPAVIMIRKLQPLPQRRLPKDFRAASLGIPVLKHHPLKVVLGLSVSVSEKHGLLGFTNDVGDAKVVAIDGNQSSQWIGGPGRRNYAEKDED